MRGLQFLTGHGYVLLCIARDPDMRVREIAEHVEITERTAHRIVSELVEAEYLKRKRVGGRNHYEVRLDIVMPHPLVENHWIGELLAVLIDRPSRSNGPPTRPGELGATRPHPAPP